MKNLGRNYDSSSIGVPGGQKLMCTVEWFVARGKVDTVL